MVRRRRRRICCCTIELTYFCAIYDCRELGARNSYNFVSTSPVSAFRFVFRALSFRRGQEQENCKLYYSIKGVGAIVSTYMLELVVRGRYISVSHVIAVNPIWPACMCGGGSAFYALRRVRHVTSGSSKDESRSSPDSDKNTGKIDALVGVPPKMVSWLAAQE